jgi:lysophospholipase
MTAISLDDLHRLRRCLPELTFDPARDRAARECPGFLPYLEFYGIDYADALPGVFHGMGCLEAGSYRIAGHYWLPEGEARGTVMVVHGYFDHVGLYRHLIRYLLERGYAVVAFDLPGHGLSTGERAAIESFDHYQDVLDAFLPEVRRCLPGPVSAVGQSTGGAILLKRLFEEGGTEFDRVVLLAPLVEPRLWWFNRFVYFLVHRFRDAVPRKFLANSGDDEFTNFLVDKDPLQSRQMPLLWIGAMKAWVDEFKAMPPCDHPVTILQGDDDDTLAWRYNLRQLRRKFPNSRIRLIEGAGHHLVNERRELRQSIFDAMGFTAPDRLH